MCVTISEERPETRCKKTAEKRAEENNNRCNSHVFIPLRWCLCACLTTGDRPKRRTNVVVAHRRESAAAAVMPACGHVMCSDGHQLANQKCQ